MDHDQDDIEQRKLRQRLFFENAAVYQGKMLDSSTAYNQVIILAGYAGYFALWSSMASDLPRWLVQLSGALMVISLVVYIGWTVLGMMTMKNHMVAMMGAIHQGPDGLEDRVHEVELAGALRSAGMLKFHKAIVFGSAAPALIAATLLSIGAFAAIANGAAFVSAPGCETPTAAGPQAQASAGNAQAQGAAQFHRSGQPDHAGEGWLHPGV